MKINFVILFRVYHFSGTVLHNSVDDPQKDLDHVEISLGASSWSQVGISASASTEARLGGCYESCLLQLLFA